MTIYDYISDLIQLCKPQMGLLTHGHGDEELDRVVDGD
jgi:hypothetical protein